MARRDVPPVPAPRPAALAGLAASSAYLLARIGTESRRRWARMLAEQDLTPTHFGMLMTLDQLGVLSQQRLSRLVGVDPRNAVAVVDLLEERRLIDRTADPRDRRRRNVSLAPAGRAVLADLQQVGGALEDDLLSSLNGTERASLHLLLHRLFTDIVGGELPPAD